LQDRFTIFKLLLSDFRQIRRSGDATPVFDVFLAQVVIYELRIFLENGVPDEALLPSIVNEVFHTDISRPRVGVHDAQTLVRRQDVNLMQCACSRNSTLFKVVPLLELKTRGIVASRVRSSE
jgi:hypothetical protein